MSLEKYEVPFALVEVSGPHNQSNHHHFVSDKVKLAKQLKASLKKIRRMIEHGDEGLYEYIKLFWYSSTPKQDVPLQPVPAKLRHLCLRRSPLFRPCSPFWVYIKFWTRTRKESMEGEGSRRCWHEIS
ncbi:hypothetical protein RMATCC62417_02838 [Rhizopus microsporus]|nr:hypothetical protein RMATCC62417_02838 [Rhizopus microsporus]CEI98283.1 hypothetical protein RMCBS344292_12395 [Rhizopus microsporus]